jgi:hypothetical protein
MITSIKQEPAMSRRSTPTALFRKSALLATALGFVALGSIMPAAAKPTSTGAGHSVSQISRLPPRVMQPTNTGASHSVSEISHLPPRVMQPTNTGAAKPISGTAQLPPNRIQQTLPIGPIRAVDDICLLNKYKCPPKKPTGGGGGPQNPGSNPSMPGGPYPTGGMGPVVISAPPVVVSAPGRVITAAAPVATTTATTATAAATEPCNCLTKQYLEDGSVLFRDLCTKEAAVATPADLKAPANASVAR